jgi:hypothetical protein
VVVIAAANVVAVAATVDSAAVAVAAVAIAVGAALATAEARAVNTAVAVTIVEVVLPAPPASIAENRAARSLVQPVIAVESLVRRNPVAKPAVATLMAIGNPL